MGERLGSQPERRTPSEQQIVAFNEACIGWTDYANDEQYTKFGSAANGMKQAGWSDVEILEALWNARPDLRPEGRTAEDVVADLTRIQTVERRAQQAQSEQTRRTPFGTTVDQLTFHTSVIQESMTAGTQILVHDRTPHVDNLPPNVPLANPRKPFYLSTGELFKAGSQ